MTCSNGSAPLSESEFPDVGPTDSGRPIAVFDIDGTVADARHRLHWLREGATHAEWVAFFAAAESDTLLVDGAALAHHYAESHDIVWVTGRPERIRNLTVHWLREHGLPEGELLMHPNADRRLARHVKLEHLNRLAAHRRIAIVVDDDARVVDLLRSHGYPTRLAEWLPTH